MPGVFLPIVFSTKGRFPFLSDEGVRREVHAFPAGIAKKLAKGDTALSVTLTATSSLVCVFTIPWIVAFSMDWFLGSGATLRRLLQDRQLFRQRQPGKNFRSISQQLP